VRALARGSRDPEVFREAMNLKTFVSNHQPQADGTSAKEINKMKKSVFCVVVATLLLAASAFAQSNIATPNYGNGPTAQIYFSTNYAKWNGQIISGNSATGSQTVLVYSSGAFGGNTLSGSNPFSTTIPIQFYGEVLTPSAVSCGQARPAGFAGPAGGFLCNVTATFANLHGAGEILFTGDNGIMEAIAAAASDGGGLVYWVADTGTVTLSTGGLTTTTTTKIPTQFINAGASAIVETTVATTASWAVGAATTGGTAFCSANTTRTAGTTCIANQTTTISLSGTTNALQAIVFTGATSNPTAGAIKARVWGYTPVQAAN
jgi:hypothetical protein